MGTPEFAVEPLRRLVDGGYKVVAVVTMPDKPSGRGLKLTPSAVKEYALSQGLKVLQPEKLRDEEFLEQMKNLNLDLGIVVAFKMLPTVVWSLPKLGTFNLHASLLPQYRGAAPINWAIMNGDAESGITTFMLNKEIDTGDIISVKRVSISKDETAGMLHDKLMIEGGDLVIKSVDMIAEGKRDYTPQDTITKGIDLRPAPKIFKDDCRIDWTKDLDFIYNKVRGLSPYPAAWFEHNGISYKVFDVSCENNKHDMPFGNIVSDNKTFIKIACNGGYIQINELQMAGKKRMKTKDFLLGNKI